MLALALEDAAPLGRRRAVEGVDRLLAVLRDVEGGVVRRVRVLDARGDAELDVRLRNVPRNFTLLSSNLISSDKTFVVLGAGAFNRIRDKRANAGLAKTLVQSAVPRR